MIPQEGVVWMLVRRHGNSRILTLYVVKVLQFLIGIINTPSSHVVQIYESEGAVVQCTCTVPEYKYKLISGARFYFLPTTEMTSTEMKEHHDSKMEESDTHPPTDQWQDVDVPLKL